MTDTGFSVTFTANPPQYKGTRVSCGHFIVVPFKAWSLITSLSFAGKSTWHLLGVVWWHLGDGEDLPGRPLEGRVGLWTRSSFIICVILPVSSEVGGQKKHQQNNTVHKREGVVEIRLVWLVGVTVHSATLWVSWAKVKRNCCWRKNKAARSYCASARASSGGSPSPGWRLLLMVSLLFQNCSPLTNLNHYREPDPFFLRGAGHKVGAAVHQSRPHADPLCGNPQKFPDLRSWKHPCKSTGLPVSQHPQRWGVCKILLEWQWRYQNISLDLSNTHKHACVCVRVEITGMHVSFR